MAYLIPYTPLLKFNEATEEHLKRWVIHHNGKKIHVNLTTIKGDDLEINFTGKLLFDEDATDYDFQIEGDNNHVSIFLHNVYNVLEITQKLAKFSTEALSYTLIAS